MVENDGPSRLCNAAPAAHCSTGSGRDVRQKKQRGQAEEPKDPQRVVITAKVVSYRSSVSAAAPAHDGRPLAAH